MRIRQRKFEEKRKMKIKIKTKKEIEKSSWRKAQKTPAPRRRKRRATRQQTPDTPKRKDPQTLKQNFGASETTMAVGLCGQQICRHKSCLFAQTFTLSVSSACIFFFLSPSSLFMLYLCFSLDFFLVWLVCFLGSLFINIVIVIIVIIIMVISLSSVLLYCSVFFAL